MTKREPELAELLEKNGMLNPKVWLVWRINKNSLTHRCTLDAIRVRRETADREAARITRQGQGAHYGLVEETALDHTFGHRDLERLAELSRKKRPKMLTKADLEEIRASLANLPVGILPDWVSCGIASLIEHNHATRAVMKQMAEALEPFAAANPGALAAYRALETDDADES